MNTLLVKNINWSKLSMKKLKSSLDHSLRIDSYEEVNKYTKEKKYKSKNIDIEKMYDNIFFIGKERLNYSKWNEPELLEIKKNIIEKLENGIKEYNQEDKEDIKIIKKEKKKLSNIRTKLFKKYKTEKVFEIIEKNEDKNPEDILKILNIELSKELKITKASIKQIKEYLNLKKTRSKNLYSNQTILKEVLIKIPEEQQATLDDDEFFLIQEKFKEIYKDYDLEIGIIHKDENKPHLHFFINGKNNKTNEYDILKFEKRRLLEINEEEIIKKLDIETIEDFNPNEEEHLTFLGELQQREYYSIINEITDNYWIFEKKQYSSIEERDRERDIIKKDVSKKIEYRNFNGFKLKEKQLQEKIKRLEDEKNIKDMELLEIETERKNLKDKLEEQNKKNVELEEKIKENKKKEKDSKRKLENERQNVYKKIENWMLDNKNNFRIFPEKKIKESIELIKKYDIRLSNQLLSEIKELKEKNKELENNKEYIIKEETKKIKEELEEIYLRKIKKLKEENEKLKKQNEINKEVKKNMIGTIESYRTERDKNIEQNEELREKNKDLENKLQEQNTELQKKIEELEKQNEHLTGMIEMERGTIKSMETVKEYLKDKYDIVLNNEDINNYYSKKLEETMEKVQNNSNLDHKKQKEEDIPQKDNKQSNHSLYM